MPAANGGGKNRATLERQALLEQAAEQGLMPVDFMLAEVRNREPEGDAA